MTTLDAIWLGFIQAATEFLPVSSSGHLRIAREMLGFEGAGDLLFDIVVHAGTLLAVLIVYSREIWSTTRDVFAGLRRLPSGPRQALESSPGLKLAILVCIATMPTVVIGLLLKDAIGDDTFHAGWVGILLLVNGVILYLSRRFQGADEADDSGLRWAGIGWQQALLIGIAQGMAVLPGISRSGATIISALALGAHRMRAAQFSFMLAIPAIVGAIVLEFDPEALTASSDLTAAYIAGALTSAVLGLAALLLLLRMLRSARLHHFAWYCWAVGGAAVIYWATGNI